MCVGIGQQVFFYCQVIEVMLFFYYLDYFVFDQVIGCYVVYVFVVEFDVVFGDVVVFGVQQVGDGFQGGVFVGVIGFQQCYDFVFGYIQ